MSIHSSRDKLLLKTMIKLTEIESRPHNIGFAIWRVKCYYETFVQDSTSVILLNFCAKMPPHRKAVNRYLPFYNHSENERAIRKDKNKAQRTKTVRQRLYIVRFIQTSIQAKSNFITPNNPAV